MDAIVDFVRLLIGLLRDPGPILTWGGYGGIALVIFLETGALVFFLPGDSLLVVAGLYAQKQPDDLNVWLLCAILIPCAIVGDAISYYVGSKAGPRLFNRPRSRFWRPEHLRAAHDFYEKHGGSAIIIARFMPIVRTFVPVVAGMAQMTYRRFATYNVVGGAAWVLSMVMLGYFLGGTFPQLGKHIEKVIIVIVFVSILPGLVTWWRARRAARSGDPAVGGER
jgi:membrane-associated protein